MKIYECDWPEKNKDELEKLLCCQKTAIERVLKALQTSLFQSTEVR